MATPNDFMRRALQLAQRGEGQVSPNPMVGAVLVHQNDIIGEGWHREYGGPHAEVWAVASVSEENRLKIPQSTLYVTLEPCNHTGKTPPCTDLILREKIPHVVVACTDPNPLVGGKGIARLLHAGVRVESGICEAQALELNRAFFTWITHRRPYIILKWAQSTDGFLSEIGKTTPITGKLTQRLVHRWRAASDAILVGKNTALVDNPRLDARFWGEKNPLRLVFDGKGDIPRHFHLLDDSTETWVLGPNREGNWQNTVFKNEIGQNLDNLLTELHSANRSILLVEGGGALHRSFLEADLWDEVRILTGPIVLGGGVPAPILPKNIQNQRSFCVGKDEIRIFARL